jgi:dTDP-4-amino-4,6-dideoxygalactose transaminase
MVDTKNQYLKIKSETDQAVLDVMGSTQFINGKAVQEFASNLSSYLGVKHVIPCANGTDALQIAMMALDLQPGDEVITPSFTYIATTEVIALLKLKPLFAEVDAKTFCINPESVRKLIGPKTKAIVPVHLYGHAAPMEELMQIAREHNLYVIEDNAQAIGCSYRDSSGAIRRTGSIGHIGATSFYPSKNLGAFGDGGALMTNDDELAVKMRMIANHGQSRQYYHDVVGCNSRLDSIQAAILNVKLKYLDEYNAARLRAAQFYNHSFEKETKLRIPFQAAYSSHVYHQYTIILDNMDRPAEYRMGLKDFLAGNQIPAMIYYPVPGHKQKMFESFGSRDVSLPVTDWLSERVLSLPIHTELDEEQLIYITSKVLEYIRNN